MTTFVASIYPRRPRPFPRRNGSTLLALGAGVLLATLLPPPTPVLAAPQDGASGVASADPRYVVALGDASTRVLTLGECIELAREQNPALAGERFRRGEVRGLAMQTVSEALPTLDLVGSWSRSRDPSFALDSTFGGGDGTASPDSLIPNFASFIPAPEDIAAQTFWRTSLNATWEINPGRIYNAVRGIGLQLKQQETVVEDTEHAVVLEVLRAYDSVRVAGEDLDALEAEIAARREFLEISRHRFQLELATTLDTLQAAVSLANLGPERRQAETRLRDAGATLNTLLGREPYEPIAVERNLAVETTTLDRDALIGRVDSRLDLLERRREIEILRKTRGARKSFGRPYFSLAGSYGYVGRELDTLSDTGHDFWSASVALTVPLFSGLLTRGRVKETEAAILRSGRELEDAERRASAEIVRLHGELLAARENREAAELNLRQAELLVAQITRRYEVGKSEYLEVLNAQSERFRARTQEITARSEVFVRGAELKRALGYDPSQPFLALSEIVAQESR